MSSDHNPSDGALPRQDGQLRDEPLPSSHLDSLEAVARAATEPESREGQIARYWFDQKFPPEVCLSLIEQVRSSTGDNEGLRMENAHLRVTAQKVGCPYGHLKDGGCELGYPGCACMDDILATMSWGPEDEHKAAVRLGKRVSELCATLDAAKATGDGNHAACMAAEAEVERLREALEPFASAFDIAEGDLITARELRAMHEAISINDFRRARQALNGGLSRG